MSALSSNRLPSGTIATLGSASTARIGYAAEATDLLAPQLGLAAVGGGAITGLVMSDGTVWRVVSYVNANTVLFPPRLAHTGSPVSVGTNTGPSVTVSYICDLLVPGPMSVTGIALFNGASVAGNIKLCLADATGAPIAATATASTAQAGTSTYQRVPFAGGAINLLGPGLYYLMAQFDNTGARFEGHAFGNFGTLGQTGQTYGTFASFTPPTTFVANTGPLAALY